MEEFQINPNLFIEKAIKEFINTSPKNRLGEGPIFDEPLVGFAGGDDPLFKDFKKLIGDFHYTPRETIEMRYRGKGDWTGQPAHVSVIAWILPIARETRLSMRQETVVPSLKWNHTRWYGEALNEELSNHVVSLLENLGHLAVAPMYSDFFHFVELPDGMSSNWSQRHACYAAGLGTFSLNEGFITHRGIAMRCGSAVCDLELTPSSRTYANHMANCLFYIDGSCRACIKRCPAGAINEHGHDKIKCRTYLQKEQKVILERLGRQEGYIGKFPSCGLCQTKVPCEDRIPVRKNKKRP